MTDKVKDALEQAKKYGYHENMRNSDKSWFGLHHDTHKLHLDLYPEKNEFEISHMYGFITVTTTKCGSFSNEKHFLRIQRQMIEAIEKLGVK